MTQPSDKIKREARDIVSKATEEYEREGIMPIALPDCLRPLIEQALQRREERLEFANIKISKRDVEIKTLREHLSPEGQSYISRILELKDLLSKIGGVK